MVIPPTAEAFIMASVIIVYEREINIQLKEKFISSTRNPPFLEVEA